MQSLRERLKARQALTETTATPEPAMAKQSLRERLASLTATPTKAEQPEPAPTKAEPAPEPAPPKQSLRERIAAKQAARGLQAKAMGAAFTAGRDQSLAAELAQPSLAAHALHVQAAFGTAANLLNETSHAKAPVLDEPHLKPSSVTEPSGQDEAAEESGLRYDEDGNLIFGSIRLNSKQMQAVTLASKGESFVLNGAAGTGKTATEAGIVYALDQQNLFGTHDFKRIGDAPSVAVVAFTHAAVRQSQKALRKNPLTAKWEHHCMTIHSLLEFEPVEAEIYDPETGETKNSFRFEPQRNADNPLRLTHLIIEEASMVGVDLWEKLYDALPYDVQIVYVGDLNQLKPVFGDSVLAYALTQLPVVQLTEVYRQKDGSPIVDAAHRVLSGQPFGGTESKCKLVSKGLEYKIGQAAYQKSAMNLIQVLAKNSLFDLESDMILIPWNKREAGTLEMNLAIATHLGLERNALVHEVRAGRDKWWLAEGDRVLVEKRLGTIIDISPNPTYTGRSTQIAGRYTRHGIQVLDGSTSEVDESALMALNLDAEIDYSDFSLAAIEADDGETSRASSHLVTVQWEDEPEVTHTLKTNGAFSEDNFSFGYCMTVHKAQGSEWNRVLYLLHWDHAATSTRESIYTALTRAADSFMVYTAPELLEASIARCSYKGQTLQDKIAYFTADLSYDTAIKTTKPRPSLFKGMRL